MMPCRKNKCLLQATCRGKEEIHCSDFLKYVESKYKARGQTPELNTNKLHRRIWAGLYKTHPNLRRIYGDEYSEDHIQYNLQTPFTLNRYRTG